MKITLKHICKSFGKKQVLKNVNLSIENGYFFVLLGPSGCGKTTLLRIIAGLEKPDSGKVFFNGGDITHLPARDRNIGFVFQDFSLYPNKTVFDNISYPLKVKRIEKNIIKKKVSEISEILSVDHILKRYPEKLSGGEAQRVAIGRALIKEPDIYLFDEPLSNIDAVQRYEIRNEIKLLHKKKKKTSIYVTHDQEEAMAISDRIAIINNCIIEQVGSIKEILEKPKNRFVATFLGKPKINLIEARISDRDNEYYINIFDSEYKISEEIFNNIMKKFKGSQLKDFILGIRPYHVKFAQDSDMENIIRLKTKIEHIEHFPPLFHLYLSTDNKNLMMVSDEIGNINHNNVFISIDLKKCIVLVE